jgi:1,4-dihydroxy-2-naphthoate polyprenyltransferase
MASYSTIKLLRIPFAFFLSPVYFFALSQVDLISIPRALLVFFIIHFLIYPASNAYNSYMDRDTGSIGGLEKPPMPTPELYRVSIILDIAGLGLSILIGPLFMAVMFLYVAASKAYSYRGIRLKKYPVLSYLVVIIFQGAVTYWLVYYGSSEVKSDSLPWRPMLVCALLIGGFYPLTQIYQHKQDLEDGVETISYKLGYRGTFLFCAIIYTFAWVFMAQFFIGMDQVNKLLMISIFFIPVIVYFIGWFWKVWKDADAANFRNTMRMTWVAAICTNISFIVLLIWRWFE